jgi:uncharacterized protein involved in response to NO
MPNALRLETSSTALTKDPWRLFFPLGGLLAWAGVLHWLLFAVGATARYAPVFHATAQIQGFLTCIVAGFLFTFIPRRTGTPPPAAWQIAVTATGLVGATLAAWLDGLVFAQALWIAGVGVLALFALRRVLAPGAAQRLPAVFLWVPIALLAGVVGSVLIAVAAWAGPANEPMLWRLGRGWLLQGLLTGLVVGVGGTMLPTLTRGPPAPSSVASRGPPRLLHAVAAAGFYGTFPLEVLGAPQLGMALRALLAGGVLAFSARLWQPPTVPGLHRRLIWLSAWLLPAGYAAAAATALDPALRTATLHVVFLGSFTLLALSVSVHVALSHGGSPELLRGGPPATWALGLLMLSALGFRLLVGLDPRRLELWLGLGAGAFLLAMLAWLRLVVPSVRGAKPEAEPRRAS